MPVLSTKSDRDGHFELSPEPGVYELLMIRKGFHEIRIPDFLVPLLVPRENVTMIEMKVSPDYAFIVDR